MTTTWQSFENRQRSGAMLIHREFLARVCAWLLTIYWQHVNVNCQCEQGRSLCVLPGQCSGYVEAEGCSIGKGQHIGVCCNPFYNFQKGSSQQAEIIFPSNMNTGQGYPFSLPHSNQNFNGPNSQVTGNKGNKVTVPPFQYIPPTVPPNKGPYNAACMPLVLCPDQVFNTDQGNIRSQLCNLPDGSSGIICPSTPPSKRNPLSSPLESRIQNAPNGKFIDNLVPISAQQPVGEFFTIVGDSNNNLETIIADSISSFPTTQNVQQAQITSSSSNKKTFGPNDLLFLNHIAPPGTDNIGSQALIQQNILSDLMQEGLIEFNTIPSTVLPTERSNFFTFPAQSQIGPMPTSGQLQQTSQSRRVCTQSQDITCRETLYRSIDGTCNNLDKRRLGSGMTGFKRLLQNTFEDRVRAFRFRSKRGSPLPSARLVSERVVDTFSREMRGLTLSIMQWGQFIDHDLSHQLLTRDSNGPLECCLNEGKTFPSKPLHKECIPIAIPRDDPFYSRFGQRCMSLVRSIPVPSQDCVGRSSIPLNELTSFLDAGIVYGSTEKEMNIVRSRCDGLLKTSSGNLLPIGGQQSGEPPCRGSVCYIAGETRVNEQSGLALMHTLFHREHNRIAHALRHIKGPRGDEYLFQQARRIVIAEWQHIIYNEWLPLIIGYDYAQNHGLLPLPHGYSLFYSTDIDPSISTEFATAAFRFGHTLVREFYELFNSQGGIIGHLNLTRTFFDPSILTRNFAEHTRTFIATRGEAFDNQVTPALHEKLFTSNFIFGLDLIALNIQRGRDHGIPTYVSMLAACTGVNVKHWGDLNRLMPAFAIERLRSVYADVADVDMFIGGLVEHPAPGALVGPTFQCVIAQQFFDSRFGDRFFYDNGRQPHSFTLSQLQEIRKTSWARIICDNAGGDITRVQPLAFLEFSRFNPLIYCNSLAIPRVDLSVF